MKKFISALAALLLILPLGMTARAQEAVTPIRNRHDLQSVAADPQGSYRLEADIDLAGENWIPIPFSGTLDGNGHTLYNLTIRDTGKAVSQTVDGNFKKYDTRFAALFSVVSQAEIRDLHILGADIEVSTDDNCFAAMLAGSATDTVISGCSASGRVKLCTTNKMVGVGGLVGFGHGTIEDCTVDCELTFADRSDRSTNLRCEQFMGGLVGTGAFHMYRNRVTIQGADSCYGFVHNGGLNGMHYLYTGVGNREVCDNHVEGRIRFFEHNPQRRAYCAPFIGEALPVPMKMSGNTHDFIRDEEKDAVAELTVHTCSDPVFTEEPVPHTDQDFGYTLHRCTGCGYTYRTDYVAPGHEPGDWITEKVRTYDAPGRMVRRCTICNQVVEEKILPRLVPSGEISLSQTELSLRYKDGAQLKAQVLPENADNKNVTWISSRPQIASVDANGKITALGRGHAVITCSSADGFSSAQCQVEVSYSPMQWVIKILLLGFLWY